MSKPRTTNAESRTKNPKFPLRIDPTDPHRIVDSNKVLKRVPFGNSWVKQWVEEPQLVDTYIAAADAAWVCEQRNRRWEEAEVVRKEREACQVAELEAMKRIPGVRPNVPAEGSQ